MDAKSAETLKVVCGCLSKQVKSAGMECPRPAREVYPEKHFNIGPEES